MDVKLVRTCIEVERAWEEFNQTQRVPTMAQDEYDQFFWNLKHKRKKRTRVEVEQEIRPVLKEFVALALYREIAFCLRPWTNRGLWRLGGFPPNENYSAWGFLDHFVIFNSGWHLYRWIDEYWHWVSHGCAQRVEVPERLTHIGIELIKQPAHQSRAAVTKANKDQDWISDLAALIGLNPDPPAACCLPIVQLRDGAWWLDLMKWCDLALSRLNLMKESLPNPYTLDCLYALTRLVDLYEKDSDKALSPIMTVIDATVADHIETCHGACDGFKGCVSTVLGYFIIREYTDPIGNNHRLIEQAKEEIARMQPPGVGG